MQPEHVFDADEFAEAIARTPPPGDSRECRRAWPPGDSTEPEDREPATVWGLLRWLFGGR